MMCCFHRLHSLCVRGLFPTLFLAVVLPVLGGESNGVHSSTADKRFEPSVNAAEAAVLQQARSKAEAEGPLAAAAVLEAACTTDSSAALPFAAGVYRLQGGDETRALAHFQDAVQRMPDFRRARANQARLLLRMERYDQALEALRPLVRVQDKNSGEFWRMIGYCLLRQDHPVAAETAYRQALLWEPDQDEALLGLLKSLLEQGRIRESVPLVRRRLAEHPNETSWWQLLAHAALESDDREKALVILESARRLDAVDTDMLAALADLYAARGMFREATRIYGRLAQGKGSPDRLLRAAETMVAARQLEEAGELLAILGTRTDTMLPPQRISWQRLRAHLALAEGKTKEGRAMLRDVLKSDPLDGTTLVELADSLAPEAPEEALELYRRAENVAETKVRALIGRACMETRFHRYDEALKCVRQAATVEPGPRLDALRNQIIELQRTARRASASPGMSPANAHPNP